LQDSHYDRFTQQSESVGKSVSGQKPYDPKVLNLLAEEREDLKLMWVPAQTGIEGNESADKAAEEVLYEEPSPEIRATENDWFKWMKTAVKKKEKMNGWHPESGW
jgi:hypothetical protein